MSARRNRKQAGFAVGAITGRWSSEEGSRSIPSVGLGVTERRLETPRGHGRREAATKARSSGRGLPPPVQLPILQRRNEHEAKRGTSVAGPVHRDGPQG